MLAIFNEVVLVNGCVVLQSSLGASWLTDEVEECDPVAFFMFEVAIAVVSAKVMVVPHSNNLRKFRVTLGRLSS